MVRIDPTFKYHLSQNAWPLALPLVNNGVSWGTAMYAYRCEYSILSNHQEVHYVYYVLENK